MAAYRVFQEAITNAARHGKSSEIRVLIETQGGGLLLVVGDNGVGMANTSRSDRAEAGLGVQGMRERGDVAERNVLLRGLEWDGQYDPSVDPGGDRCSWTESQS